MMNEETVLLLVVFFGTADVSIIPVLRGNSVNGAVTVAVCNWKCSTGIGTGTPGPDVAAASAKFLASTVFEFAWEEEHKESEDTTAAGPCSLLLVLLWWFGVGVDVDDEETVQPISTRSESINVSLYPRL